MVSPFGGLIPQIHSCLMKAKYYVATIFVGHNSDYAYAHLQTDTKTDSTIVAKNALLMFYGHNVHVYYFNNGRYTESAFKQYAQDKVQQLSHCGVGSHHQNRITERHIKSIVCKDSRMISVHRMFFCPGVVTKALWWLDVKVVCRTINKYNLDEDGLSQEMKLA